MTDEITLTLPRERPFFRIAHLVLGGLAVRLDLTFDNLEDLQLALAAVLDRRGPDDGQVTVTVSVEDDAIRTRVGPFEGAHLREELEREPAGEEIGLRRLLDAVVDRVEVEERGGEQYVEFVKSVERARV